ncbi:MAG: dihydrodipicolinate synthase family protein [Armatimonadota bacterium]|nr:dihydrodipicolinate synthase family protein [Armatimonadota bacterium]
MRLSGIVVATITPMTEDGASLAGEQVFTTYYDFLIGAGVHGVFICGTTGEGALLSMDERMRVTEWTVRQVAGRVPVIVQAGAMPTAHAVELAKHAASAGANAIAVLTPYFYPMDHAAMFQHFQAVAAAAPALPVYLYNIPSFARNEISPELVVRLRTACPNIAGMKHSDANLVRLQEYLAAGGEGFDVLAGADAVAVGALAAGASGCVSGNASAIPEVSLALYDAVRRGDLAAARRQQQVLHEVRALLGDGHSLASFKAALRHRGIPVGGVRAPHRALTPDEERRIEHGLADLRRRGYLRTPVA